MHLTNDLTVSSLLLLWTCGYGRAHTLLPDITAHSCLPRVFAISCPNPDSHQPHSTASPSPRGSFTAGRQAGLFPASLVRLPPSIPHRSPYYKHPKTEHILLSPLHRCLKLYWRRDCPAPAPIASFAVYMMRLDRSSWGYNNGGSRWQRAAGMLMSSFKFCSYRISFYFLVAAVSFKVCHADMGKKTCQQTDYTI